MVERDRRWSALVAATGLLLGACLGCEPPPAKPLEGVDQAHPTTHRNVVLVSLDTLRADRLGSYGYGKPTSPHLDALAGTGARFTTAVAESSWTLPTHMSLFTGRAPDEHGVTGKRDRLSEDIPILGELVRDAGLHAGGFTAGGYVSGGRGFARGFEVFDDSTGSLLGAVSTKGLRWRRGLAEHANYLLFLHTYDIHCPYAPPRRFREPFVTVPKEHRFNPTGKCGHDFYFDRDLSDPQTEFVSQLYDAGVRHVDHQMQQVLRWYDASGARENTLLIILSDHGEELGDHGQIGHARTLKAEVLRVPLILVGPGIEPQVIDQPVQLADVMPTILEFLGIPIPSGVTGQSLMPLLSGEAAWAPRPLFSEMRHNRKVQSVYLAPYHFVRSAQGEGDEPWPTAGWREALFDWDVDRAEKNNLMGVEGVGDDLLGRIRERFARVPSAPAMDAKIEEEQRAQLRALGYLE